MSKALILLVRIDTDEAETKSTATQSKHKKLSWRLVTAPELLPATAFPARLSLTLTKLEEIALLPCSTELHHTQLFEKK